MENNKKPQKGFVYFMTDITKLVKIGMAKNVKARFGNMQTGNTTLKLLYSIKTKNMELTEQLFHDCFKDKRIVGEWFELTEEDLEYIKKGDYSKTIANSIENGDEEEGKNIIDIVLRIPEDMLAKIDRIAEKEKRSRNNFLLMIINKALEESNEK